MQQLHIHCESITSKINVNVHFLLVLEIGYKRHIHKQLSVSEDLEWVVQCLRVH